MWIAIGVPIIAAVAAGLVSRWALPSRSRRVSHAKAEAELLQLLRGDSPAAKALRRKIDVDVLNHVRLDVDSYFNATIRSAIVLTILGSVAVFAVTFTLVQKLAPGSDEEWVDVAFAASLVLAIALYVALELVMRRARKAAQRFAEDARRVAAAEDARDVGQDE